jgi:glutaredoxin
VVHFSGVVPFSFAVQPVPIVSRISIVPFTQPIDKGSMITVYGADWCEDTRRSQRLLRRLHVPYHYLNIDEDLDALDRAKALNQGNRRTPTIDLGLGGQALVEPDNETLTAALLEREMLTREQAHERLGLQNVGDLERVARTTAGLAIVAVAGAAPPPLRWPLRLVGFAAALTGVSGWCPGYYSAGVTSIGGPGDRPDEAERARWLVPRAQIAGDAPPAGGSS